MLLAGGEGDAVVGEQDIHVMDATAEEGTIAVVRDKGIGQRVFSAPD
jgi:hypothetical protein